MCWYIRICERFIVFPPDSFSTLCFQVNDNGGLCSLTPGATTMSGKKKALLLVGDAPSGFWLGLFTGPMLFKETVHPRIQKRYFPPLTCSPIYPSQLCSSESRSVSEIQRRLPSLYYNATGSCTVLSLTRNHNPVTQTEPQALLRAVLSC